MNGFRQRLFDVMGGVHGCTHLTELIAFLPTAALQTFAGLRREIEPHEEGRTSSIAATRSSTPATPSAAITPSGTAGAA